MALFEKTKASGDKVAALKKAKAPKDDITAAVQILLANKAEYEKFAGTKYDANKPPVAQKAAPASSGSSNNHMALFNKTKESGDKVAALKKAKASKEEVTAAVQILLANKAEYEKVVGSKYDANKPPQSSNVSNSAAPSNDHMALFNKTKESGDKVAALKKAKASKDEVTAAVQILLANKAEYEKVVGSKYDANKPPQSSNVSNSAAPFNDHMALFTKTKESGDKVAALKKAKASKDEITAAVQILLANKAEYEKIVGSKYDANKPPVATASASPTAAAASSTNSGDSEAMKFYNNTKAAGDKVAALKKAKASKDEVAAAVKILLDLKTQYKQALGHDYDAKKPPQTLSTSSVDKNNNNIVSDKNKDQKNNNTSMADNSEALQLYNACKAAGDKVRQIKKEKGDISDALAQLKASKAAYKEKLGHDYNEKNVPGSSPPQAKGDNQQSKQQKPKKEKTAPKPKQENTKGVTKLGVSAPKTRATLSDWYSQVITKSEMIEYYNVSGCYILRPWAFSIWEGITAFFDKEIKKLGVQNASFPMFVSQSTLEKEKDHIEDFAPEVAWVTKAGNSDLAEPIAIRPTSETVMYPAYKNWVQSHRDLPIRLNQWCNVVRWEFKHPTPFLRTREFLWQEGHSAFADKPEAVEEVYTILDLYRRVYEDLLAIPVVPGKKTEKEKFAGGDFTTTVEAYISVAGRAIQGATSHHLGQNFSKMFDISFQNPNNQNDPKDRCFAYQNSWGITTRTIGVMVMVHGDDKGLVLPPRIAQIQAVLVPVGWKKDEDRKAIEEKLIGIKKNLQDKDIRVKDDFRTEYTPGWKFSHWEQKGVPLRIEIGPKDMEKDGAMLVRRDTGEKILVSNVSDSEAFTRTIIKTLDNIQCDMFNKASEDLNQHLRFADKWEDFIQGLNDGCLVQVPFCGDKEVEAEIKTKSAADTGGEALEAGAPSMGAKSLCIPAKPLKDLEPGMKCILSGRPATSITMFGRSY